MFARFVLFCFLTLQTNLKHFALAYIKNHFVNYSQRFNIIDELSMCKQNETVRRGSEFLQLLFIFPYLMFFYRFRFHFPLLIYNTHKFCLELMENMLRAAVAAALRVIPTYQGEGEEQGCLGIPLYVIHMYNKISHLASFMQPNPPVLALSLSTIKTECQAALINSLAEKGFACCAAVRSTWPQSNAFVCK